ncbi:MAG: hypothetical protein AABW75_03100 [Nanoarchaeota archaeon]
MGFGEIIESIFVFVIGGLIISFLINPSILGDLRRGVTNFFGTLNNEKQIDMHLSCQDAKFAAEVGSGWFGANKESILEYDCSNACKKVNMSYSSWGCNNNNYTCFCK